MKSAILAVFLLTYAALAQAEEQSGSEITATAEKKAAFSTQEEALYLSVGTVSKQFNIQTPPGISYTDPTGTNLSLTKEFRIKGFILETGLSYDKTSFVMEQYHSQHVIPSGVDIFFCNLIGGSNCDQPYDTRVVDAHNEVTVQTIGVPIAAKYYFLLTPRSQLPLFIKAGVTPYWQISKTESAPNASLYTTSQGTEISGNLETFDIAAGAGLGFKFDFSPKLRVLGEYMLEQSLLPSIAGTSSHFVSSRINLGLGYAL